MDILSAPLTPNFLFQGIKQEKTRHQAGFSSIY
jgi:hypothetical protein